MYAVFYILGGRIADRLGYRRTFTLAMVFWSLATMAHALVQGLRSLFLCQALLGMARGQLLSRRHARRRRVVSTCQPRQGRGHNPLGHQPGDVAYASAGGVDHPSLRMAGDVSSARRARLACCFHPGFGSIGKSGARRGHRTRRRRKQAIPRPALPLNKR